MYKQIKNNKGFTIIEVMIVLAIAALILIIVLLAVPALQRNAKNTTAKNDASTIAGAVSDYESNNNGTAPTGLTGPTNGVLTLTGPTTPNSTANISGQITTVTPFTMVSGLGTANTNTIDVYFGYTCNGTSAPTASNQSGSAVAIYYPVATSGGTQWGGCIQG